MTEQGLENVKNIQVAENRVLRTTVTENPKSIHNFISGINSKAEVFVNQNPGEKITVCLTVLGSPLKPPAVLSLLVEQECFIIKLTGRYPLPLSLGRFLENPCFVFAGVNVERTKDLLEAYHKLNVGNVIDLGFVASVKGKMPLLKYEDLKSLVSVVLRGANVTLPEQIKNSSWDNIFLVNDQVKYACVEIFAVREVARGLDLKFIV